MVYVYVLGVIYKKMADKQLPWGLKSMTPGSVKVRFSNYLINE